MKKKIISMSAALCATTSVIHGNDVIENECLKITFDRLGARIIKCMDKTNQREFLRYTVNHAGLTNLGLFENHESAYPYKLQYRTIWKMEKNTGTSITFSKTFEDGAVLRETFTLLPGESKLTMFWSMHNTTDRTLKMYPWFRNSTAMGRNNFRGITNAHERKSGLWQNNCTAHHELGITSPSITNWCSRSYKEDGVCWFYTDVTPSRYYNSYMNNLHTLEQLYEPVSIAPGKTHTLTQSFAVSGKFDRVTSASPDYVLCVSPDKVPADAKELQFTVRIAGVRKETVTVIPRLTDINGKVLAETGKQKVKLEVGKSQDIQCTFPAMKQYVDTPLFLEMEIVDAKKQSSKLKNAVSYGTLADDDSFFPMLDYSNLKETPQAHAGPLLARTDNMEYFFVDSMEQITPMDYVDKKAKKGPARIELARNEGESFLIAAKPRSVDYPFRLQGVCGKLPKGLTVKISPVRYTLQTGALFSFYDAKTGRYPEIIMEDERYVSFKDKENALFYVDVHAASNVKAGKYKTELIFHCYNVPPVKIPLEITVWDFTLNSIPAFKTDCGDSFGSVKKWFAKHVTSTLTDKEYVEKVREQLFAHKLSPRFDPLGNDPAMWEQEYAAARAKGASHFNISTRLLKSNPELLRKKGEFFASKNALDSVYVYAPFDEIGKKDEEKYIKWVEEWRKVTKIPVMLTYYASGLYHMIPYVDVWARTLEDSKYTDTILEKGGTLYQVNPASPANGIDIPMLNTRQNFLKLLNYKYTGGLIWTTANWLNNKWTHGRPSTSFDAVLVLPTDTGVLPTIRLKAYRDGIEDYEYIYMLRNAVDALKKSNPDDPRLAPAEKLLKTNLLTGDKLSTPEKVRAFRKQMAEQIIKLNRKKK